MRSGLAVADWVKIACRHRAGFSTQAAEIIGLFRRSLCFDAGLLCQLDHHDTLTVVAASAPADWQLYSGGQFPLGQTFWRYAAQCRKPCGFTGAVDEPLPRPETAWQSRLTTYLGAPIWCGDQLFGFVSFCDCEARNEPFSVADYEEIEVLSWWLGAEIERREEEAKLRESADRMAHLSRIDPLTELLNRRGIDEMLQRLAARETRGAAPSAAILIDLDDFRSVNRRHGHAVGDMVLGEVANQLRKCLRPTDLVGRVGGDEFLAVLPYTTIDLAERAAHRLRTALACRPIKGATCELRVTASLGLAPVDAQHQSVAAMVEATAEQLAGAKRASRAVAT